MTTSVPTCRCGGTGPAAVLDLRQLAAPEPMQQALAAADRLAPGDVLQVLTPLMPMPLLAALAERGLKAQASSLPEGGARIVIHGAAPGGEARDGTAGA